MRRANVEYAPELEKPQFNDLVTEYKEIQANVRKLLASYVAKVDLDPEPTVFIEPDIVDKLEPKIVNKPNPTQNLLISQNQSQKLLLS